jgi:hypothetical protein
MQNCGAPGHGCRSVTCSTTWRSPAVPTPCSLTTRSGLIHEASPRAVCPRLINNLAVESLNRRLRRQEGDRQRLSFLAIAFQKGNEKALHPGRTRGTPALLGRNRGSTFCLMVELAGLEPATSWVRFGRWLLRSAATHFDLSAGREDSRYHGLKMKRISPRCCFLSQTTT